MEHCAVGMEHIAGTRGKHYWSHMSRYLSRRFLRPLVNKYPQRKYTSVMAAYQRSKLQYKRILSLTEFMFSNTFPHSRSSNALKKRGISRRLSITSLTAEDSHCHMLEFFDRYTFSIYSD